MKPSLEIFKTRSFAILTEVLYIVIKQDLFTYILKHLTNSQRENPKNKIFDMGY